MSIVNETMLIETLQMIAKEANYDKDDTATKLGEKLSAIEADAYAALAFVASK